MEVMDGEGIMVVDITVAADMAGMVAAMVGVADTVITDIYALYALRC